MFLLLVPLYVKVVTYDLIFEQLENSSKRSGVEKKEFGIVLGAGIKSNGTPGSYLRNRLEDASELYNKGKIKKILLTGDNSNSRHDEISIMNNYLIKQGVPQEAIFGDYAGFDTYSSVERADKIFHISDAIFVTQSFHLPRTLYIAQSKGINAVGYSTMSKYGRRQYFVREWFATIKSVFDCFLNRNARFYGKRIDTNGPSNILKEQL